MIEEFRTFTDQLDNFTINYICFDLFNISPIYKYDKFYKEHKHLGIKEFRIEMHIESKTYYKRRHYCDIVLNSPDNFEAVHKAFTQLIERKEEGND